MTDDSTWPREGNIEDPTRQYTGPQPDPVEGNDDEESDSDDTVEPLGPDIDKSEPTDTGEVDQEEETDG